MYTSICSVARVIGFVHQLLKITLSSYLLVRIIADEFLANGRKWAIINPVFFFNISHVSYLIFYLVTRLTDGVYENHLMRSE